MNPLTFQMQISNSLETQIKHYTEELNKLLSIANGKEIKIGVSDSLTQLVAELQKGMLNITKAQNESVEAGKKAEAQTKAQAEAINAAAAAQERLNQLTKAHDEAMAKLSNLKNAYSESLKEDAFVSRFIDIPNKIGNSLEVAAEKGKKYIESLHRSWGDYMLSGSRGTKGAFYDFPDDKKAIEAIRSIYKYDAFDRYRNKSVDELKEDIETLKFLRQKVTNQGDYGSPEWKGYNMEITALESLIKVLQKCREEQDKFLSANKDSKYVSALPKKSSEELGYKIGAYKKQNELKTQIVNAEYEEKDALSALNAEKAKQASASQQSAQTTEKETQAVKENTAAKEKNAQTKAQPKQLEFDFSAQTTKLTEFAENVEKCIGRIKTAISELTASMGKGVDNTAFVQSLSAFTQAMQPFADLVDKLSASSGKYQDVMQKLAASSKDLLASVQQVKNVESSVNSKTTGDAQKDAAEGMRQYINNVNKLEHALMRLDNAISQAESDKARIAKNSGDTDKIKAYIDNLNNLREAILKVQQNPDILGQKGTMFRGTSEELNGLIKNFKTAAAASKGTKEDIANILGLAREIGNKSPLGVDFIRGLGGNQNFTQYANKLEAAVPKLNVANEKMAESMARLDSVIGRSNGKGRVQELEQLKQKLQDFENSLSKLSAIDAAAKLDNGFTKLIQDIQKATNAQENLLSSMDKLSFYQKNVFGMLRGKDFNDRFRNMMERYNTLTNEQGNRFIENSGMRGPGGVFDSLIAFNKKIEEALKNPEILSQKGKVAELTMEFNKLSYAYHSCWSQAEKLASAQDRANKKSGGLTEDQIKLKEANDLYSAIVKKLTEYNKLIGKAGKLNIDTTELEKAIAELEKFRATAKSIADGKGVGTNGETARQLRFSQGYVDASSKAEVSASTLRAEVSAAREAASATERLSAEQQRLADAFRSASREARGQSQVLSDLKSLAYQYFSVYGVQSFLTELTNVTGELELQKKSLEVILGSGSAATDMYMQLRDLSQQSPYTFEDLLKSHRQLAAFGVEAKDIYGTMKSLTDIGAGLDVDVSRLILAYGHTKSYGYLSGIQNRQFETAGIDLVGGLADLYNKRADEAKRNGQQANYVSRKDIFGLMRKREIPFEDVQDVVMDLDKPGGKFYNMQERQYNTLGGKLRNLKNNYRIMLSEMGGSGRGILVGFVNTLNELTAHWDRYAKMLTSVAAAYGVLKGAQLLAGKSMLAQNAAIMEANKMLSQTERGRNFLANVISGRGRDYRRTVFGNPADSAKRWGQNAGNSLGITDARISDRVAHKNQLLQVEEIKNNKQLSEITKQRIALTGRLTQAQRTLLLMSTGLGRQQAAQLAGLGAFRRGLISLRLGFIQTAAAARAFLVALAPQAAIMAVVTGISAIVGHVTELSRKAKEISGNLKNDAATNAKSANEIIQSYADRGLIKLNSHTMYDAMGNEMTKNKISLVRDKNGRFAEGIDLSSDIEEMKKKMQVLSPLYDGDLLDINKMQTQEEQFEAIINKIEAIRHANEVNESISNDLANSDKRIGGIFSDSFTTDMQDYSDAVKDMRDRLQSYYEGTGYYRVSDKDVNAVNMATGGMLAAIKNQEGLTDYKEALQVLFNRMANMTDTERQKYYDKLSKVKTGEGSSMAQVYEGATSNGLFGRSLSNQYAQLKADAITWSRTLGNDIVANFAKDPEGAVASMVSAVNSFLASSGVTDPSIKQDIIDSVISNLKQNGRFNVSGVYGGNGDKNTQYNIGDLYGTAIVKEMFAQNLSGLTAKTTPADAEKIFKDAYDRVEKFVKSRGIVLKGLGKQSMREWLRGLYEGQLNSLRANEAWQIRAKKALTANAELNMKIKTSVDIYELADEVQKKLKESRDKVEKMIPHIKALQVKLGINFNLSSTMSLDNLKKQISRIKTKTAIMNPKDAEYKALSELLAQYNGMYTALKGIGQEANWLKSEGFKDDDEEKRQKKAEAAERKAEAAKRKAEEAKRRAEAAAEKADRNDIKQFNDRINALGKARQMYEDWYNRYKDKDYAIAQVRERMESALNKGEYVKGSINAEDFKKLDSLPALRDILVKEQDIIGKWKPRTQNGREQKNSMLANVESQINQIDTKEADKQLKEFADGIKRLTELVSNAYDTFKSVRDKTGDTDFALQISRFKYKIDEQAYRFDWAENVNNLFSIVESKLSEIGAQLFSTQDMGELYNLSGDNLKSRVSGMLQRNLSKRDGESNKDFEKRRDNMLNHVDAIVTIVEQFNSAMKNMVKSANDTATELYASSNSFKQRRQKANTQFEQNEKDIDRQAYNENGKLYYVNGSEENRDKLHRRNSILNDPYNKNGIAWLQYDGEMQRMLNAPTTMRSSKVRQLAHTYISAFNDAFLNGFIDETRRNTEVDKAQKAMRASLKSTGNSLVGQMSFAGGMFFDPTKHTQDLQSMRNAATVQLSEQMALSQGEQDANLIAVLQRLVQALDNILSGVGGKSEIAAAARTQKNVNNWSKMKKGQQVKAGEKAKDEFSKNVNDPFGFWERSSEAVQNAMGKFIGALSAGSQAVNLLSDTFDKLGLGDTGMGQAVSDASGVMSGMLSGASSLSALGPYGMAAGAALGLVGGIAQTHDKRLQRKIEKMQEDVSKIESYTQVISKAQERTLGYDYGHVIRSYQKMYNTGETNVSGSALGAMQQYYAAAGGGDITGYQQQYNLLVQKRRDYSDMYNAENKKKKKSKSSLEEYKSKIAELDDQIKYFSEDIAKNLYSIDLKSWADQLSDALMTAFENGDDAAEAFKNSVTSILQSLTKQMISLGVMQPLFDNLRNKLFGYTDSNGAVHKGSFDASHPDSNKDQWMSDISEALGKDGYIYNGVESSKILFDKMENLVEKSGNTLLNSGSSSAGSSIKGITEQTADLLASYLNAIRADVSVLRQLQSGKTADYMDSMSLMAQSQVQYQSQIAANTLRNAEAAEKIVTSNEEILYLFKAVTNDTKTVSTRVR